MQNKLLPLALLQTRVSVSSVQKVKLKCSLYSSWQAGTAYILDQVSSTAATTTTTSRPFHQSWRVIKQRRLNACARAARWCDFTCHGGKSKGVQQKYDGLLRVRCDNEPSGGAEWNPQLSGAQRGLMFTQSGSRQQLPQQHNGLVWIWEREHWKLCNVKNSTSRPNYSSRNPNGYLLFSLSCSEVPAIYTLHKWLCTY